MKQYGIFGVGLLIAVWLARTVWTGRVIARPFNGALTGMWTAVTLSSAYAICMISWTAGESFTRYDGLFEVLRIFFITVIYTVLFGIVPAVAIGMFSGWLIAMRFRSQVATLSSKKAMIEAGIICFIVAVVIHLLIIYGFIGQPYIYNLQAFFFDGAYPIAWGIPTLLFVLSSLRIGKLAFERFVEERFAEEQHGDQLIAE